MISNRRILYQIFYPVNKFDDPIQAFSDYFCTPEYLKNISENQFFASSAFVNSPLPSELPDPELSSVEDENIDNNNTDKMNNVKDQEPEQEREPEQNKNKNIWFEPNFKCDDTLFWCLFYHVYGLDEYGEIHKNFGKRELEEKQKIVEFYTGKDGKKNAAGLKFGNQKLTNADIQETLSGLMVNKKTQILELYAMAAYYKVGVILCDPRNHTCIELMPDNVDPERVYKFYYNTDAKVPGKWRTADINSVQDTPYYRLEQWNKPLKAVSTYKLNELQEIATQLGVDIHLKKQELYEKLAQTIVWKN